MYFPKYAFIGSNSPGSIWQVLGSLEEVTPLRFYFLLCEMEITITMNISIPPASQSCEK